MKKIIYNALLSISLLIAPVMTASALDYTIKQGGATETVTYTTWVDLVTKVCTYTGTESSPVEVEISGLTLTKNDMGGRTAGGWIPGLLKNTDVFSYTTISFNNCEFNTPDYPGLGFEPLHYPGNKLKFTSCSFNGYSIYGINSGNPPYYAIDFEFYDCQFLNGAGIGGGGCWYGDITVNQCTVSGTINANCGFGDYPESVCKNSKGESSTLSIENTVYTNTAPGFRGLFGNFFGKIKYKKAENSPQTLLYKVTGWPIDTNEYEFIDDSGECTFTPVDGYVALYVYSLSKVFYNANGGSGTTEDTNTYIPGVDNVTFKANKFTKPGYAFTNWNTEADGSGTSYSAGQTVKMPFGSNYTVYAQWEEAKGPSLLNVQVTGLAKGESEVFGVYSVAEGGAETFVMNVAVTGSGTGTDASTVTSLPDGTYSVKPAAWAWAYTNSSAAQSVTVADGTTSTAEFTLTAKTRQPSHGEKARVNEFK